MSSSDQSPTATPEVGASRRLLDGFLDSPFAGIAPWIVMSLLSGPNRFEASVVAALGLSMLFFVMGRRRGGSIKLMEVFDLIFFIGFAIIGLLASEATITWLELWAGEITNIALVVFVLFTIVIRQPFTLQYAKETVPSEMWDNPVFLRINYVISWVWAVAFGFSTIVGLFGDAVLKSSDNFWTGWIMQLAATIFAVAFTAFYPDYARAKATGQKVPSKWGMFDWLPVFVIVTGAAGLITDSLSTIIGGIIIAVGVVLEIVLVKWQKAQLQADENAGASSAD